MKKLSVSDDLSLPVDAVTSTMVVYGGKGMGKSNFGRVLAEEIHGIGGRFSAWDPLDVWWGLQHGQRGEPGIPVWIMGGTHGNMGIHPGAGAVVADFVVDEDVSTIVVPRNSSGEMWTPEDRTAFATAYALRLFARQGEKRKPLHQIVDEAGRVVPQLATKGDREIAACVSAWEQLLEWGRNAGVGATLITQRSARMAKSVSELADCMVAFRTVGPRSVSAILDWFGEHVAKDRQKDLVEQLRELDRGEALVVSPGWLKVEGRVKIRLARTFDSSQTPQAGGVLRAPGKPTTPDAAHYQARMKETVERAAAEDPKALRARIAELERSAKAAPAPASAKVRTVEVEKLSARDKDRLEKLVQLTAQRNDRIYASLKAVEKECEDSLHLREAVQRFAVGLLNGEAPPVGVGGAGAVEITRPPIPFVPQKSAAPPKAPVGVAPSEQKVIDAIAWLGPLSNDTPKLAAVGFLTGYTLSGGRWGNLLRDLKKKDLVAESDGRLALTAAGAAAARKPAGVPTGEEIQRRVLDRLPPSEARLLRVVLDLERFPDGLTLEQLGNETGYDWKGGRFGNVFRTLKSCEMVTVDREKVVRPSPLLFGQE